MSNKNQNMNFWSINKFVDASVKKDIIKFHNQGNIHFDKSFQSKLNFPPIPADVLASLEGYDTEISPFHHESIPCHTTTISKIKRRRSANVFSPEKILFSQLQALLSESFAANEALRRPYPSGGALYTVETLCCILESRVSSSPASGIYHYRPNLGTLQLLQAASEEEMRRQILAFEQKGMENTNFILIYIINLSKAVVKYRYRGYRLAFMEVGAMFQQAGLIANELGLNSKVSSSFNDHQLSKLLALDNFSFVPAVIQLFGKET